MQHLQHTDWNAKKLWVSQLNWLHNLGENPGNPRSIRILLLMVQKSQTATRHAKDPANHGMNYQTEVVQDFFLSTVGFFGVISLG